MERKQRHGQLLDSVAELFDLPGDVVAGLPHVEMIGQRQLYVEQHSGILRYQEDCIDVNTPAGVLRVQGAGLTLLAMTAGAVRISGKIRTVEWVE